MAFGIPFAKCIQSNIVCVFNVDVSLWNSIMYVQGFERKQCACPRGLHNVINAGVGLLFWFFFVHFVLTTICYVMFTSAHLCLTRKLRLGPKYQYVIRKYIPGFVFVHKSVTIGLRFPNYTPVNFNNYEHRKVVCLKSGFDFVCVGFFFWGPGFAVFL